MGIVSFSIPQKLVLSISGSLNIPNFVETGTYKGNSSIWASKHFKKVYTIEINEAFSKEAAARKDASANIEFIVGDSKTALPALTKRMEGRGLFWLDGHWCMNAGGKDAECPIIDELKAISYRQDHIILIDDARCFLGPLAPPHNAEDWPRIDELFKLIATLFPTYRTTIIDDVIVSVPPDVLPLLDKYWQDSFQERYYSTYSQLSKFSKIKMLKYLLGLAK